MCGKCNTHLLEKLLNKIFTSLQNDISTSVTLKVPPIWIVPTLEEDASIGKQIQYYRRLANVKQTDLGLKLGYGRDALRHLEQQEIKLIDINLLTGIIKELNIEDKIIINDDYISFLLDNPCEKIQEIRKQKNMSLREFGDLIGVSDTSVRRWELGNCHISREMFKRLKKCME